MIFKTAVSKKIKLSDRKWSRGSAIVEAAMIFPIVIGLVFLFMLKGNTYRRQVADIADANRSNTIETVEDLDFYSEDKMRTKWEVKRAFR